MALCLAKWASNFSRWRASEVGILYSRRAGISRGMLGDKGQATRRVVSGMPAPCGDAGGAGAGGAGNAGNAMAPRSNPADQSRAECGFSIFAVQRFHTAASRLSQPPMNSPRTPDATAPQVSSPCASGAAVRLRCRRRAPQVSPPCSSGVRVFIESACISACIRSPRAPYTIWWR